MIPYGTIYNIYIIIYSDLQYSKIKYTVLPYMIPYSRIKQDSNIYMFI